jgi:hypothetical protein
MRSGVQNDTRIANVGYGLFGPTNIATGQVFVGTTSARQPPLDAAPDLPAAFAAVERDAGRALREQWAAEGMREWSASAQASGGAGASVVIRYFRPVGAGVTFRYDVATGRVERTQ